MSLVETTSTLTPELLELMEHEKVIEQGLASFIDVGCALIAIKAGAKYRHAGYDAYVVAQQPELPMANRREDLLFRRP